MNVDDQTRTETGVREECGVFGIYDRTGEDVAPSIYYGLCALQHRGQESCGIAVSDTDGPQGNIAYHKDLGLVSEVFKAETMSKLHGNLGIGHVRYSTTGASVQENAQPLVLNYIKGTLALAHNGNLVNAEELKKELVYGGAVFHTTTDSEMIAYYIARERGRSSGAYGQEAERRLCSGGHKPQKTDRGPGSLWAETLMHREAGQRLCSGF